MPNLAQLRLTAREIFKETLAAVDPGVAVRNAITPEGLDLKVCDTTIRMEAQRPIYSLAIGKAAYPMASALDQAVKERLTGGQIVGPQIATAYPVSAKWHQHDGAHPLPEESSLKAAASFFALLKRANEQSALVFFLVSGGGSAMIESPLTDEITLSDLRSANRVLVHSGASIVEINAVRRAFSAVKGGRLAARAPNCDQITLIVSDVPAGEEASVASGPTLPQPTNALHPGEVIARYDLRSKLPETILKAIDVPVAKLPTSESELLRKHFVLLDNAVALAAAAKSARQRGYVAGIARDVVDQPIELGCTRLWQRFSQQTDPERPVCLVSGGEFTCAVRGEGMGGRNLETALRIAISNTSTDSEPWVALCAGTDGIDGNSPAAGAIVDSTTIERARTIGLVPEDFLNRSDAYSFFVALGDVVATGPTGTNVRDVRLLLK